MPNRAVEIPLALNGPQALVEGVENPLGGTAVVALAPLGFRVYDDHAEQCEGDGFGRIRKIHAASSTLGLHANAQALTQERNAVPSNRFGLKAVSRGIAKALMSPGGSRSRMRDRAVAGGISA